MRGSGIERERDRGGEDVASDEWRVEIAVDWIQHRGSVVYVTLKSPDLGMPI